ncbi:uncharacterized protein N7529_005646 [Penicillium soppii]|uniref:uncharacterized protein n=1 Tax=Penicillium soppii TaxID=69789 RepID=UPI002547F541|nr:uncharacterized protein N7529_005646 [Penicillium soppii]KAJ5863730.1 hypothetical protein N7529_005646 [Penicillium soppii]
MAPTQAKIDSRAATLFFKKHKTTVLLLIQLHETLDSTKEKLLYALKSRAYTDINGDPIPDDAFDIELGVPIDRAHPEKGWRRLEADASELDDEGAPKKNKGKSKKDSPTLRDSGIDNAHVIAFRFRKIDEVQNNEVDAALDIEEPGWDVIIPSLDDEEL